ncbi:hypothetical protein G4177_24655 [Corallococcus sp. ZKHCc1 1396]|uniref:Uncharacterized protein n=1 Tax=Corallococcus soli TaxID=2710757 RepID=A0ABR9PTW7_9BACT|nr:hypothetical protein [Corallococcus soli]MBE4751370.1 hypothetical protein [Corallococcus soli]
MGLHTHGGWPAMFVAGCLISASALAQESFIDLTIKLLMEKPEPADAADFKRGTCAEPEPTKEKISCDEAQIVLLVNGSSIVKPDHLKGSFCLHEDWNNQYIDLHGQVAAKGQTLCLKSLRPGSAYSIHSINKQLNKTPPAKAALAGAALFELQVWGTFIKKPGNAAKSAEHFKASSEAHRIVREWLAAATYTSNKNPLKSWLSSPQRLKFSNVKLREAFERTLPNAELTEPEWNLLLVGNDEQAPTLAATIDALLPPQLEMAQALASHYSTIVAQPLFIGTLPANSEVIAISTNTGVMKEDIASGKDLLVVYGHNLKATKAAAATGDKLSALPTQDIAIKLNPATQALAGGLKLATAFGIPGLSELEPLAFRGLQGELLHLKFADHSEFLPAPAAPPALPLHPHALSPEAKQVVVSSLEISSKFALLDYTSTVLLLHDAGENKQYRFAVCQNVAACDEKTDVQSITADLRVRALTHSYVSLGTEVTVDVPLYPDKAAYGGYQFVQVSGGLGPNKIYELQPSEDFSRQVTISALLIGYPLAGKDSPWIRGVGLALEGGLFRGGQPAFLSQWGGRVIYEFPGARGLFISTGVSWRSVSVPVGIAPGTLIAVPSSGSSPAYNGRITWLPAFSLGFGIDLGVVGEAVKSVGDTFTGARSAPTTGIVSGG